ncbi:unnamed protein product [Cylindrotheca closterium]|uniref:SET domain-containing protein n=1 Tax=Cylindrotheca closterium TaxID=2856 RepID=A0AAD2JK21_9STRA|nr:unnamed protein product [Cylindrotheca closterium]
MREIKQSRLHRLTFCFILLAHVDASNDNERDDNSKCGLYLAPSSIPHAGLGMYAGHREYKHGEQVTDGDIVIPIFEMEWHNQLKDWEYDHFLWDEYTWNGEVFPGSEEEQEDVSQLQFASPGVGAAANSYLSLVNINDEWIQLDLGTDVKSPGAGAQTPYHGRSFSATSDIPMGGEIWVSYGSNYFASRERVYGYIPLPDSYPPADKLLKRFERMRIRTEAELSDQLSPGIWEDLLDTILDYGKTWKTSRVLNALPDSAEIIPDVLMDGGTAYRDFNRSTQELSWLEENGQCMDNIKVLEVSQESPDAGRGAAASRFIPKDGLVAPAPVIHVPDYEVLEMFLPVDTPRTKGGGFNVVPDMEGPVMYQLLLNYCFGHEESTLLLCPYGLLTALINHSSENANTRVVWSDAMRHKEWLNNPIEHFGEEYIAGLQLDYVALRDIEEGEEILIDYGEPWEKAWEEHKATFAPRENYVPAFELNKLLPDLEFRTVRDRPYFLDGVQLRCRTWYVNKFQAEEEEELDDYPCQILKKLGNDRYQVQVVNDESDNVISRFAGERMLWDVPVDAFLFIDLPYERLHHFQFDAFRHAMTMPDDIFPEKWKNIKKEENDEATASTTESATASDSEL